MQRNMRVFEASPLDEVVKWVYQAVASAASDVWGWFADIDSVGLGSTTIVAPVQANMTVLVMSCYVVMVVVGGVVVMTHESLQSRYSVKEILPRLVMGMGLVWAAPLILEAATKLNADVVEALISLDDGELDHWAISGGAAPDTLVGAMRSMYINAGVTEMSLMAIVSVVLVLLGAIVLLVSAMMRWLAMLAVVALAPVALACHGLPITEAAARLWWRMLGACMASSIGQAVCLYLWRHIVFDIDGKSRPKFDTLSQGGTDGYYIGVAYMAITIWAMWKVHATALAWARGRNVSFPGSRLAKGLAIATAAGWIRRRGNHKPNTSRTARPAMKPAASKAASKYAWSTVNDSQPNTGAFAKFFKPQKSRSIRVQRSTPNMRAAQRGKTAGRLGKHVSRDSRDIGVEPWDLKHWPVGAQYPRRDPKRPITPMVADGADSRVRVKRGLSVSTGVVRRLAGTPSPDSIKAAPPRKRTPRATPAIPARTSTRPAPSDTDALTKASQRLRRDQINRNAARQAAANRHLERRANTAKPTRQPQSGEK